MKLKILATVFLLTLMSCKKETKQDVSSTDYATETIDVTTSIYPENITNVFNAHGGLDVWNSMNTLSFTINKPDGPEITTLNLKNRAELIETPTYLQGYDGSVLWVNEKEEKEFKGNAKFYRGLMMYFYAMPFILGDEGIIYKDIEPLSFENKTYPGILISYEAGIGTSPDDQYKVYYDQDTNKMAWLGYTVTYGKNEKSNDFHFIRYNNWQTVNGLIVPKSIDWYNYEDGKPTEKRNTLEFSNIILSKETPDYKQFEKPEGAKIIE